MLNIPVKQIYVYDPIPLAAQIEGVMAPYILKHDSGIYMRGSATPILTSDRKYYCRIKDKNGNYSITPLEDIDSITGDILDDEGNLLIPLYRKKHISTIPTIPVQGIKIIYAYVEKILHENSEWARNVSADTKFYIKPFIKPEYRDAVEIYEHIQDLLIELKNDIKEFIGKDTWVMHFCKMYNTDILVEKTTDYRVYQWSMEHLFELGPNYAL